MTRRLVRRRRPALTTALGAVLLGGFTALAVTGVLSSADPNALVTPGPLSPSFDHPFGTDTLGRDLFTRVADGAWTSFTTSTASILLALVVAVPLGVFAAWAHDRWPDRLLMRLVETLQIVPPFVLAIVILGLGGPGDLEIGGVTVTTTTRLVVCLAAGFVPFFARVTRSAAVAELQEEYVDNLRLLGVPDREVLFGEVVPNVAPVIAVQVFLAFAIAVFAEGGLSFLGLGVAPPAPTLGNLVTEAGGQLLDGAWWYAVIPGLVLVAGITGANLLGDAATDRALDARRSARDHPTDPLVAPTAGGTVTIAPDAPAPLPDVTFDLAPAAADPPAAALTAPNHLDPNR